MKTRLLSALLPLTLLACAPRTPPAEAAAPAAPATAAEAAAPVVTATAGATTSPADAALAPGFDPQAIAADLARFHWALDSASSADGKRIDALFPGAGHVPTLDFADGRLSVSGGCNGQSGATTFGPAAQFTVSPMRATLMACDAPLMQADQAIAALFAQPQQVIVLDVAATPARLELKTEAGTTSRWIGTPTAQARHGGPGRRVFLEVAAQAVDCPAPPAGQAQCLSVREISFDEQGIRKAAPGAWRPLAEPIEGFTHVPGTRNVLRLDAFGAAGQPVAYVLDMVVESAN